MNGYEKGNLDLRLRPDSPAVGVGVKLPEAWPDSLDAEANELPDIGALPVGLEQPWNVGVGGKASVY